MRQLRVLHVIPNLKRGGAERLVIDTVRQCNISGMVNAQIVVLESTNEYAELTKDIDIQDTRAHYQPSIWRKDKVNVASFRKFVDTWQPDIIHTHLFQADFLVRMAVGHDYPIVTHFHDNMAQYHPFSGAIFRSKKVLTNYYERRLIRSTFDQLGHRFIAISRHTEAYLHKVLPKHNSKVRLLFNAIDLERFHPPKQQNLKPNVIQLINIGSFVPKKNQRFLVEVMERLPEQYHLLFLGDGPDRRGLKDIVKQRGLSGRVQFAGIVHHPEAYLRDATIYVHAASYEPFGLALVEAMATGLPVVTLDGGGNRDIVENGVNGYLLEEADPNQFAQQVKALVDQPDTYQQLSRGALQTAQRFGMEQYVDRLVRIYQEAIAEAGAPQTADN